MDFKRYTRFLSAALMAGTLLFATSCDDDSVAVDPLVGFYTFGGAGFTSDVTISLDGMNVSTLPAPSTTTATLFLLQGLFDSAPCTAGSGTTPQVELRADGTSWLVCDTAPVQQGTWSQDAATGDITLIVLAVNTSNPSGPDLQIIITGVTVTATQFNGTVTNFPLPLDATQTLGLPGTGPLFDGTTTPPGAFSAAPANIQLVGVTIAFNKTP